MADEFISQLTPIAAPTGTPPYPTAFTNPSTGALLEILDQTNTAMAPTGTNSAIAPGHLLKGFLNAGSNVTITESAGIVTIASAGIASSNVSAALASPYTLTTSYANSGLSISLPTAGVWAISGFARGSFAISGAADQYGFVSCQLYDSTNSVLIPNSNVLVTFFQLQTSSNVSTQLTTGFGPFFYTTSVAATIQLQGQYGGNGTITVPYLNTDSNGATYLAAYRIA